jgi:hypothetical protein
MFSTRNMPAAKIFCLFLHYSARLFRHGSLGSRKMPVLGDEPQLVGPAITDLVNSEAAPSWCDP